MSENLFITQAEQSALIIVDVQERLAAAMPDGVRDRVVTQLQVLLVAAKSLKEPVARGGPFVMNTRAEVMQAFEDYENNKF